MPRLLIALLLAAACLGPSLAAGTDGPPVIRFFVTGMEDMGEVQQVTTSADDQLRLTVHLSNKDGRDLTDHSLDLRSEAGNEVVTESLRTDERGWVYLELHPVMTGVDRLLVTVGDVEKALFIQVTDRAFGQRMESPERRSQALPERDDVVSWSLLSGIETREGRHGLAVPVFNDAVRALHRKEVRVQGFMLPLENSERQRHFLLTRSPPSCFYCLPDGPEQVVEVRSKQPIRFTFDPIAVSGRLELLESDDDLGLFYRLTGAEQL